ncbi:MAG: 3-dehydroquinate synthase, partial [Defluviitaleaceae bacterium]|nr:3-dehydroquinate synthase [Defluviitaleaceae bacterium]
MCRINCLDYEIIIETGFDALVSELARLGFAGRKICIVSDAKIADAYAKPLQDRLSGALAGSEVSLCVFPGGEESKNLAEIQAMYAFFLEKRLDRKSLVLALGGGVTGDAAGFAAATYMRGLDFVQLPTTLLAQTDAGIGGKVAVDFQNQKNLVGAFYQPRLVYINLDTLKTLPPEHFANGMAEIIKHGLALDAGFAEWLWENRERVAAKDADAIREMLRRSCAIKAGVVSRDAKEAGERELLNFGHTFGHAVESLSGFAMYHGYCVAAGMVAAMRLSMARGYIAEAEFERGRELIAYYGLPTGARGMAAEEVLAQMRLDKKTRDNNIRVILLEKIGKAYVDEGVGDAEMKRAIGYILA